MSGPALLLDDVARAVIVQGAQAATPLECGGIMIGYHVGADIVVTDALPVSDRRAHRFGYVRGQGEAQVVLDGYLERQPPSSLLGWVGDYHSHPLPVAASRRDLRTLRRAARNDGRVLGLIIAAATPDRWGLFGYLSSGRGSQAAEVRPTGGS